jgi:hypothetical protein
MPSSLTNKMIGSIISLSRNAENSSTKQSLFFNTGFHPTFKPRLTEAAPAAVPAAADLAAWLEHIHTELCAELKHAQEV